jgi:iron(III) transport system ATP-binding protein
MACRQSGTAQPGERVSVFMRPESFRLSRRPHSDAAWPGTIEFSIYHGDCWDYHVRIDDDLLKVRVYQEKVGLAHGDSIFLEPDPESAIVISGNEPEAEQTPEKANPADAVARTN